MSRCSHADVPAYRPYLNGVFRTWAVVFVLKQMNCCSVTHLMKSPSPLCSCNQKSQSWNHIKQANSSSINFLVLNPCFVGLDGTPGHFVYPHVFNCYFHRDWTIANIYCYILLSIHWLKCSNTCFKNVLLIFFCSIVVGKKNNNFKLHLAFTGLEVVFVPLQHTVNTLRPLVS